MNGELAADETVSENDFNTAERATSTLIKVRTQYDRRLVDFVLKSESNSRKKNSPN